MKANHRLIKKKIDGLYPTGEGGCANVKPCREKVTIIDRIDKYKQEIDSITIVGKN